MSNPENDIKIRILRAAKKLFAENGFDGTSVRQICEEAGANVSLVSYHFGGKENVFAACSKAFSQRKIRSMKDGLDPVEGVRLLIREVTLYREAEPELISIVQQEIIRNTPRIQKIREHVMPMWMQLRDWLERGTRAGGFQVPLAERDAAVDRGNASVPSQQRVLENAGRGRSRADDDGAADRGYDGVYYEGASKPRAVILRQLLQPLGR